MAFFDQIDGEVNAELQARHDEINQQADALKHERATVALSALRQAASEANQAVEEAQREYDARFQLSTEPTPETTEEPQG